MQSSRLFVRFSQLLLVLDAFALSACDAPTAPAPAPTPVPVASIALSQDFPSLARGAHLTLTATPRDAQGRALEGRALTWTSLDPERLAVTAQGRLSGLAEGSATLRLASGGITRDVPVTIVAPALASLTFDVGVLDIQEGDSARLVARLRNVLQEVLPDASIQWESADETIATVTDGAVRGLREGVVIVRAAVDTIVAEAEVRVRADFGGDLLFVSLDGAVPLSRPRIFRGAIDGAELAAEALLANSDNWQPAVSPDGTRLAFTCSDSGPAICVSNLDGSNFQVLTVSDNAYEDQPSWDPEGMRIAFRRWSAVGASPGAMNPSDIWVMNADGSGQLNLTADTLSQSWPSWSPGAIEGIYRIAFVQDSTVDGYRTSRIAMMSAFGTQRRYLTDAGPWVDERPRWAPDGVELVFTRSGGEFDRAIMGYQFATGAWFRFLYSPLPAGGQFDPVFSPNGRYIVFSSQHEVINDASVPQVYTARRDGRDVRRRGFSTRGRGEFAWVPTP